MAASAAQGAGHHAGVPARRDERPGFGAVREFDLRSVFREEVGGLGRRRRFLSVSQEGCE
jgi:hypothetical protein